MLEGSTGFSGAFARQITLNRASAVAPSTNDLLSALEQSATEGGIVLQGEGVFINSEEATQLHLSSKRKPTSKPAKIIHPLTRTALLLLAADGHFVGTSPLDMV